MYSMKRISNLTKFLMAIIFFAISISSLLLSFPLHSGEATFAASDIMITNGDFTSTSGSDKPESASNWTKLGAQNGNIKSGVMKLNDPAISDTDFSTNKSNYGLEYLSKAPDQHGGATDRNALLINNTSTNSRASSGYETSNAITLLNNSYYKISVYAMNLNNSTGTIYLTDTDTNADYPINSQITVLGNGTFVNHTFYIETNKTFSTNLKIELWLGGKTSLKNSFGAVIYDTVTCTAISEQSYHAAAANLNSNIEALVSLVTLNNKVFVIDNADFESQSPIVWEKSATKGEITSGIHQLTSKILSGKFEAPLTHNNSNLNINGLLIASENGGYVTYSSNEFVVKQNEGYKISYWAKTDGTANASVKLTTTRFSKNGEEVNVNEAVYSDIQSVGTTTDSTTNNYGCYTIIVRGNINYDATVKLELNFGSSDSNSQGYVIFDTFTVEKLSSKEYSTAMNATNAKIIKLYSSIIETAGTVTNGYFNIANEINYDDNYLNIIYPLKGVASWTQTSGSETGIQNGIIDVNDNHFGDNASNYGTSNNPGSPNNDDASIKTTNNVLMMRNINETWQNYQSETKSLSAGSVYRISVDAYRDAGISGSGKAYIEIRSGSHVLKQVEIVEKNWITKEIYIISPYFSSSITINLMLGNELIGATGHVYFDNIEFDTQTTYEEKFKTAEYKVDLSGEDFKDFKNLIAGQLSVYETTRFTLNSESSSNSILGVVNPNSGTWGHIGNSSSENDSNVLMLKNNVPTSVTATGAFTYNLESGKQYKVSAFIKLTEIDCESDFEETDDLKYGATIKLTNFDTYFSGQKNTVNNLGESIYVEYVFYINVTTSRSFNFEFSLGNEDALTSGNLFCDKLLVETIDEDTFKNVNPDTFSFTNKIIKIENTDATETTNDDEIDDDDRTKPEFDWMAFSTIVLVLTLLVVVATVTFKKINWSKFKRRGKISNEYDKEIIEQEQKQQIAKEKANKLFGPVKNFFAKTWEIIKSWFTPKIDE